MSMCPKCGARQAYVYEVDTCGGSQSVPIHNKWECESFMVGKAFIDGYPCLKTQFANTSIAKNRAVKALKSVLLLGPSSEGLGGMAPPIAFRIEIDKIRTLLAELEEV